jgi:ribosomal protein L16 Arg81 hydroxylase
MTERNADPDFEVNAARHRAPVRFAEYVDKVYSGAVTNDYNLVANNGFFQRFATHRLLKDLAPSLPYLRSVPAGQQCFLWFGPAGTLTPLHHDTSNILVAQIAGRKRYRLVPSTQWQCVYNRRGVFSDVDPESPDLTRFPRFRQATVLDFVLEPGQVFFIPVGWWHHVRSLDVSISVSFTNFAYPNHFHWEPKP